MTDGKLHDDAEEIRHKTAEDSPELQEHDRVAELEQQLEELKSKALYAAAETQNVRRRLEAEKEQASSYAAAGFARDMLAIKDHLDRALAAVSDAVFQRNGVARIKSVGEALDPHRHQAMVELPSEEAAPGTIVEEMQPGYMMKDRLLRPALVGVAKKPG